MVHDPADDSQLAGTTGAVRDITGVQDPAGRPVDPATGLTGTEAELTGEADAVVAALPRLPTGVAGLDHLLRGGLVAGRTTLVVGTSGSGKTLLCSQILHNNAVLRDGPAILVSFEEPAEDVIRNVQTLGFGFDRLIAAGKLEVIDASPAPQALAPSGAFDLSGIILQVRSAVEDTGAKLVVLDSLGGLFTQFGDVGMLRRELVRLRNTLREMGCTAVMTAERAHEYGQVSRHGVEDFVADCVVILRHQLSDERVRRTVQVYKIRGDRHREGGCPVTIIPGEGLGALPLSAAELSQEGADERVPFGNEALDAMTGGGLFRDSIVLIIGPTGGGKTLLCTTFAAHGCSHGDRVLFLGYEESRPQLGRNARNWGYDFAKWEADGLLQVSCEYPENRLLEGHLLEIRRQIDRFRPTRLVIDSITALERVGTPRTFREFLIGLSSFLKRERICACLTSTGPHTVSHGEQVGVNVSTLTDAIFLLRYVEREEELGRALTVIKMRGSQHDKRVRAFTIDDAGLHLGDAVSAASGLAAAIPG